MQRQPDYDHAFQITFCGNSGVGKSTLLRALKEISLGNVQPNSTTLATTIGVDMTYIYLTTPSKQRVRLVCKDIMGQDKTPVSVTDILFRSAGLVIIYDLTNEESFKALDTWLARRLDGTRYTVIVGNKLDKADTQRKVHIERAAKYAAENGLSFFETSAYNKQNVEVLLVALASALTDDLPKMDAAQQKKSVTLGATEEVLAQTESGCPC